MPKHKRRPKRSKQLRSVFHQPLSVLTSNLINRPKRRLDLQRRQDQQLSPMRTLWIRGFVSAAHVKILFTHSFHTQKYTENRRNMLTKATEAGVCIYPHKFAVSISIPDFISKFSHLEADERLETETVSVAGNLW